MEKKEINPKSQTVSKNHFKLAFAVNKKQTNKETKNNLD
jgi:hypothetical protein